jgi:hypothetical protein
MAGSIARGAGVHSVGPRRPTAGSSHVRPGSPASGLPVPIHGHLIQPTPPRCDRGSRASRRSVPTCAVLMLSWEDLRGV